LGDFYKSIMNTERIEELGFSPVRDLLQRVEGVKHAEDLGRCIAELRFSGVDPFFTTYSTADKKNSSIYALYLDQGGLSLPDKEYYLAESFAEVRRAYQDHVAWMFTLEGESDEESKRLAEIVLEVETSLARSSRARADLRDEEKNYNKTATLDLATRFPSTHFRTFLKALGISGADYVVIGQPEFFTALDELLSEKPIEDLRAYLRWRVIHAYAPFLHKAVESEDFEFFHRKLEGQEEPEARWKIAAHTIDGLLGEALGELYVEKYFPPDAKRRLVLMIEDIKQVFADRLRSLPWMTEGTRKQALAKFARFNTKIGHPERFRDYSSVKIEPVDLVGNIRRASEFEVKRQAKRVGELVDKSEWFMTPPTVNAYFSPTENEIAFPAGILQPPFFDVIMDDAVNYATIGAVIAHEITHGYDDQGRRYDAEGNLRDWWVPEDEKEFQSRAKAVVELYSLQEPLPGMPINGELTLGGKYRRLWRNLSSIRSFAEAPCQGTGKETPKD
jgi:putative endopeptidase